MPENRRALLASLLLIVVASVLAFPHASKATAGLRSALLRSRPEPAGRPSPMFATITVTTTADTVAADGACSLREAIMAANSNSAVNECAAGSGTDTITFNIGGGGLRTIVLTSGLPAITAPLIINGTSQPGFVATPLIELNGNGVGGNGLTIQGGGTTIRGLIINRFNGDGITIQNNGNNVIAGNYIGINSAGTAASANTGNGITIQSSANNTIGGTNALDRNIISGNAINGIVLQNGTSSGNQVLGNFIGTNAAGTAAVPNNNAGIRVDSAPNNTIGGTASGSRNIISGNTNDGIQFVNGTANGNLVAGNFIGTDVNGTVAVRNGQDGISIGNGAQNNTIGGTTAAARNVISGNGGNGVAMVTVITLLGTTPPNNVLGNYIGTNAAGTGALGNLQNGVSSDGVPGTIIGGLTAGARNVISGNAQNGVRLINSGALGTLVQGNFIGTDFTGIAALGNTGAGVSITNVQNNTIGGITAGAGNIISANGGNGVTIIGASSTGNRISSNSIFSNSGLGIDLGNDGVTPNDASDGDSGPNNLQNFPRILDGVPVITGLLKSTASTTFRLEFFSSPSADPTGFGEGKTFLGIATVTTNGGGNAVFFFSSPQIAAGQFITATATDPTGNTSEFSQAFQATAPTSVEFGSVKATRNQSGVAIGWHCGLEMQNLGYNVYRDDGRDQGGQWTLITPQPIAGTALVTTDTATNDHSYTWIDQNSSPGARYWIEDIDLSGKRTMHGPFTPIESSNIEIKRSRLLTELNADDSGRTVFQRGSPVAAAVTADASAIAAVSAKKQIPPGVPNPLEGQSAAKIFVNHDGWYRVSADQVALAGLSGNGAPKHLQLFTGGVEVPIQVNEDLSVEFYGQGLDTPTTDKRCYWLVVGQGHGLRINNLQPGQTASAPQNDFTYVVEQRYRSTYFSSLLNGDQENIFGPLISGNVVSENVGVQGLTNTANASTLEIALQGLTDGPHAVQVTFNGTVIGTVNFDSRDHAVTTLTIPAGLLAEGQNNVSLARTGALTDLSLLDYLRITYQRQYLAIDNSLSLTIDAGNSARLTGFTTDNLRLFDITDPQSVTQIAVTPEADSTGFALSVPAAANARTMLALSEDTANAPVNVVANNKSDWRRKSHAADLLVVSYKDFLPAIDPLVQTRRAQGLKVEVADIDDVFDEFSFGEHTPQAIRDFLSWTKGNWRIAPRFVLLVGDSTWDPRNYLGKGDFDLVPTKLIDTAQLETASDDWMADFSDEGLPQMAIGRLPVRTADQAIAVVSKILAYDTSGANPNGALLVADTGFEANSTDVRTLLPAGMPVQMINRSDGLNDAAVHTSILAALNQQPLFVNYTGHGSVNEWTGAKLLTGEDAAVLTNSSHLPVMMLMTCLNGYSHDVFVSSLSKTMFLQPNRGAVAVWSSSGSTTPDSQQQMARLLYQKLFGIGNLRLGEAILAAKAGTLNPDVRRTWMLLGDPTMLLVSH